MLRATQSRFHVRVFQVTHATFCFLASTRNRRVKVSDMSLDCDIRICLVRARAGGREADSMFTRSTSKLFSRNCSENTGNISGWFTWSTMFRQLLLICTASPWWNVDAHRSIPAGVTCSSQFFSPETAVTIPNPKVSWASSRIFTCGKRCLESIHKIVYSFLSD